MDQILLKTYALSMLGVPYFYGGDDPVSGFDCSGLVSELLRACGLVHYNWRGNAQQIRALFGQTEPHKDRYALGDVVFFGKDNDHIEHVGFCLDDTTMIEAGGGDHTTTTPARESEQNAFVRLRPIRFRKDLLFGFSLA